MRSGLMIEELYSFQEVITYIEKKKLKGIIFGAGQFGRRWAYQFLKEHGILIDAYCDNNPDLWGTKINGIKVIAPAELESQAEKSFVFIMTQYGTIKIIEKQLEDIGVLNYIDITELTHFNDVKTHYFERMNSKIAVYTCVIGDYDIVQNHSYISEKCDYFLISDIKPRFETSYKYIPIDEVLPDELKDIDATRKNRYCKINAHKLFPEYRYSIYTDASTHLTADISFVVEALPKTRLAVASRLFERSLYSEAIRIIAGERDYEDIVKKQMNSYWIEGMPDGFGQYWNHVLVREHNNPVCKMLMEQWWEEVNTFSRRDQLSLPYVIWKNGFDYTDVGIIDELNKADEGDFKLWIHDLKHASGMSRV